MEFHKIVITENDDGRRLDRVLREMMPDVPNSHICRMLRTGELRVNGKRSKPEYRLSAGDWLRLPLAKASPRPRPRQGTVQVPDEALELLQNSILHENQELMIINKPAGLAVHGGSGLRYDLLRAMRQLRPKRPFLELGHRLDRDTSGCLLLCKNAVTQRRVHAMFRDRSIRKLYVAMVLGVPDRRRSKLSLPLQRRGGKRQAHSQVREDGEEAITMVKLLQASGKHSLLQLEPVTGRTHQLRVHMAHVGHPIAGDRKYGCRDFNRELRALGLDRLFLHSRTMMLPAEMGIPAVEAELPPELGEFAELIFGGKLR